MKEKRLLSGILALALCLAVCFAAGAEVKSHDTMANGKIKETAWTDENGNPAPGPDGYAYIRYTYKGQDTFEYYFNEEGDPYQTDGGYYGRRILRDGKKRPVEIEYLDEDGKRTDTAMGYAQVLTAYTSFGGIRQVSYYGVNKKPVIVPSLGYASMVIEYSGKTVASKTFRNTKGNPVDSVEGYAVMKQKIDKKKKNQVTSIRYDHADGTPATGPDGWFRCVKDRDDKGRLLSVKYYDVNSQMTDRGAGYAWEGYAYDGDSTVKVTRYDLNGQPVTDAAGVATTVREMKDDLVMKERFLDADGNRVNNGLGVAEIVYGYDANGALQSVSYRDTEGSPALCSQGYAGYKDEKDEDGATVSRVFLDKDGLLVQTAGGYSEIRYTYDETKQIASTQYYDVNGSQIQAR